MTQGPNIECGIKERCFMSFKHYEWDRWAEENFELWSSRVEWFANVYKWPWGLLLMSSEF